MTWLAPVRLFGWRTVSSKKRQSTTVKRSYDVQATTIASKTHSCLSRISYPGKLANAFSAFLALCFLTCISTGDQALAEDNSASLPTVEWDTTINHFQFDADKFLGQRLTVNCPPLPLNQSLEGIFGTDVYPSESSICVAALHAGVITKDGGIVTIQLNPGEPQYSGSERNGVKTLDLPRTRRSIAFVDDSNAKTLDQIHLTHLPRIDWDTKFTATGFARRNLVGQSFSFRLPAAPKNMKPRIVYGTDSYAFASLVGRAAMHAGKLSSEGGVVTVRIDSGVPKLVGSIRHGVETKTKGGSDRSISFVENPAQESASQK